MEIIENSNIIKWDDYPEFLTCLLIIQNTEDAVSSTGLVMPKNTEFSVLLDKIPFFKDGELQILDTRMYWLDSVYLVSGHHYENMKPLELHIKPGAKQAQTTTFNVTNEILKELRHAY